MSELDNIDEELEIMNEQLEAEEHSMSNGINIEDPIKTLNLAEVVGIARTASLQEAIELLNSKNIGCLLITDEDGEPVGIFTERDVLRRVAGKSLDLNKEKVKGFMTPNPETLSENDPIAFALNRMSDGSYRHIPIMHEGRVRFMLSVKDIVDQIAFVYRKNVLNLPPNLQQTVSEYGG